MKNKIKSIIAIVSITIFLGACSSKKDDPQPTPQAAHFTITSSSWSMTSYGSPQLKITVKNDGTGTGYNLDCEVKAMSGNTIVDVAHAFPANLGNITVGQSAMDYAVFFNLTPQQSSTCTFTTNLTWLN